MLYFKVTIWTDNIRRYQKVKISQKLYIYIKQYNIQKYNTWNTFR